MINIYGRVSQAFDLITNKTEEYKKGFQDCLLLFKYGISTHVQFSNLVKIHELEKINHTQRKEIKKLHAELTAIREKSDLKLLLSVQPLEVYHRYLVNSKVGSFEVVVNMDNNSFNICLTSFSITHSYENIEQAKSKLLQFINLKNGQGYKAYKNAKEAIKEGVRVV